MSSKSSTDGAAKAPMFTEEGLPLHHACFGASPTASDACDGGPARRVECRQPQLLSAPSLRPAKGPLAPVALPQPQANSLVVGPTESSLIDDDDDEIVDYFGAGSCHSAPIALTSVAMEAPSSTTWAVRESYVPTLPSFYPLEKSAVYVPQASAPIMASRIASVLQARSITASYDARNAKVDCLSASQVEFRIRLYRGRGEYSHGIIAEVQRRSGFDLSYAQDMYAILDAAEGKDIDDHGEGAPIFYEDAGCSSDDEEDLDALEITAGFASLQVIADILCPQDEAEVTVEGQDFALASLASLTSLDHMGHTAAKISNELLDLDEHGNLRQALYYNICSSESSSDSKSTPQRSTLQSLKILANVAASSQGSPQLSKFLSQDNHKVFLKLTANIENARHNPQAADLSCAILKNVLRRQADESAENALIPSEHKERLLAALMNAVSYGGECHTSLERHSQQCLGLCL